MAWNRKIEDLQPTDWVVLVAGSQTKSIWLTLSLSLSCSLPPGWIASSSLTLSACQDLLDHTDPASQFAAHTHKRTIKVFPTFPFVVARLFRLYWLQPHHLALSLPLALSASQATSYNGPHIQRLLSSAMNVTNAISNSKRKLVIFMCYAVALECC